MESSFPRFFSCVIVVRRRKKTYLKRRPLCRSQIFSVSKCCDIQGSHLIGYLWVSLIIDQSECLICFFLCTELTLFCTELPENCIYLNQSELSNCFMYVISSRRHSLYFCVLVNIVSRAAQSNSVYVSVLKIPIVHADSVSKSLRQKFFFRASGHC